MKNAVEAVCASYPDVAQTKLLQLRDLILQVAKEENLGPVTETLKWGEPSYLTPKGSTLRMDWKKKSPDTVSLFFHCQSLLVETFKEIFGDTFHYVGSREIQIPLSKALPIDALKLCIATTFRYHEVKKLPLLGL